MAKNFRQASREEWTPLGGSIPTAHEIHVGALQRIADATEKMAQHYSSLIDERNRYKGWFEEERESGRRMERRIVALRGVITRLKKRTASHG